MYMGTVHTPFPCDHTLILAWDMCFNARKLSAPQFVQHGLVQQAIPSLPLTCKTQKGSLSHFAHTL